MQYEFRAGYAGHDFESLRQLYLHPEVMNNWTLLDALAQTVWEKNLKLTGLEKYVEKMRDGTLNRAVVESRKLMEELGLDTLKEAPVERLPPGSFWLRLEFELETPYMSKDDVGLTAVDNPVRKDKVFRVPLVSGSTWKGALRSAIGRQLSRNGDDAAAEKRVGMLFGKAEDGDSAAGRVECMATFFGRVANEMINPHERATKTGTVPVRMECVPAGEKGELGVLYVNRPEEGEDRKGAVKRAIDDLPVVAAGCASMLAQRGFGAKKSSGYGAAKDSLRGLVIAIRTLKGPPTRVDVAQQQLRKLSRLGAIAGRVAETVRGELEVGR